MTAHASATVTTPCGTVVHLLGVSHTSSLYGKLAYEAIRDVKPDAVILEVDEARLREQAERACLWLEQSDRHSIVKHAVKPFLSSGSLFTPLSSSKRQQQAYSLANEGSALLEGGLYGSEVVLACEAATATGADVVLADRSKSLSRARLQAAMQQERFDALAALPDDDWSLLHHAATIAARNLCSLAASAMEPFSLSDGQLFGVKLHPIFLLADVPEYRSVLTAVGCDNVPGVVASLRRLMADGSRPGAQVDQADLEAVQQCIANIERHKHRVRQHVFAEAQRPAASTGPSATCAVAAREQQPLHFESVAVQGHLAASSELLELSQRFDASMPEAVLRQADESESSTLGAGTLAQQIASAARQVVGAAVDTAAPAPSRSDVFAQWCWRGAGRMESFALSEHVAGVTDAMSADDAELEAMHMTPYYRTTVFERDSILAQRIWRVAAEENAKRVVAVVGANHIPGILRNWGRAGSAEAQAQAERFLCAPAQTSSGSCEASGTADDVRWKGHVVDRAALLMEATAVGAATYAPWRLMRSAAPRMPRWVPLAVALGVGCSAALAAAGQQRRVAQLVENVALCQDRSRVLPPALAVVEDTDCGR